MKAIGYSGGKPLQDDDSFIEFELIRPEPRGHDLLVQVEAVSVNPVDFKIRARTTGVQNPPRILGWDAAGRVESVGDQVTLFRPGDKVFYAGDITRSGSNASFQLVDERIVGQLPKTLDFAAAAALPLTAITAWEGLFERLKIDPRSDTGKNILIIGAAGGVGSMVIQLAKKVAGLKVIATASRDETRQWCTSLGADHCIDHHGDLQTNYQQLSVEPPDYIFCLNHADQHSPAMVDLIAPQGMICTIVETGKQLDLDALKAKSAGFVWEFMFTRSMHQTDDMIKQHELLNEIAHRVDVGELRTTLNKTLGNINAENIREAHRLLETGSSIGKIVLAGW